MLVVVLTLLILGASPAVLSGLANPTVKNASLIAVVSDPSLNRDSCGSVAWGSRVLWTCRDTNLLHDGRPLNLFSSSASHSDLTNNATLPLTRVPADQPTGMDYPHMYTLYGDNANTSFFRIPSDACGGLNGGNCNNGSRYVVWPQQPPLVSSSVGGSITAYTWIKRSLIKDFTNQVVDPATILYKLTGHDNDTSLPAVSMLDEDFFDSGYFAYGEYGSIVVDNTAYLYAVNSNRSIALAKAPVNTIEDKSTYQYYIGGSWVADAPDVYNTNAYLGVGAGGGQGTFYYSSVWQSFVWLGQPGGGAVPEFWISLATAPEGPWSTATKILEVTPGNYTGIGAYSLQAHPELSPGLGQNAIYVTYTQQYTNHYETPLYLIEWD